MSFLRTPPSPNIFIKLFYPGSLFVGKGCVTTQVLISKLITNCHMHTGGRQIQILIGLRFFLLWNLKSAGNSGHQSFNRFFFTVHYKYLLPVYGVFSHFLNSAFAGQKILILKKSNSSIFFFHGSCFRCCISEVIAKLKVT